LGGKKIIIPMMIAGAVFLISGCGLYGSTPGNSSTAKSTPAQETAVTAVTANTVNIQNFAFSPATLTVKKGTAVTWTNNDSAPHQIKSATFNSSQFSKGQTFSFTFNDAGTFDYSCAIHPSMLGKIIVE
jgi:plastocyanin